MTKEGTFLYFILLGLVLYQNLHNTLVVVLRLILGVFAYFLEDDQKKGLFL